MQARLFIVYISLMVITFTPIVMIAHIHQHQISIPAMHQVLLLNNPPVWDLDIIDDIMGDTGDILDDLDDTLVDIEKNRSVIIEINYE